MISCNASFPPSRDVSKLQPYFSHKVEMWLEACPEIAVNEALRHHDRQKCLLGSGASRIKRSKHQDGLAVDVHFKAAPHFPEGGDPRWLPIRKKANEFGIVCGWDLWHWDAVHFQCMSCEVEEDEQKKNWKTIAREWAMENGVSNGERPGDYITRVEVMEMIRKFDKKKNTE